MEFRGSGLALLPRSQPMSTGIRSMLRAGMAMNARMSLWAAIRAAAEEC